jgi:hypothetical protein
MARLVCSEMLTLLVALSLVFLAAVGLGEGASAVDPACRAARVYENLIDVGLTSDDGKGFPSTLDYNIELEPQALDSDSILTLTHPSRNFNFQ